MESKLLKSNINTAALDSLIHDAATDMAKNANNGDIKGQIEFLNMAGLSDERIWAKVLINNLQAGFKVDVGTPQHDDSQHFYPFKGIVERIYDDFLVVIDEKKVQFTISFDEVDCFKAI